MALQALHRGGLLGVCACRGRRIEAVELLLQVRLEAVGRDLRLGLGVELVEQGCSVPGEWVAWVQSASSARKQAVQIQLVSFLLVVWGGRQKLPPTVSGQR